MKKKKCELKVEMEEIEEIKIETILSHVYMENIKFYI
jgi:hypothetical protein